MTTPKEEAKSILNGLKAFNEGYGQAQEDIKSAIEKNG